VADDPAPGTSVTASGRLRVGDDSVDFSVSVPSGAVPDASILPFARSLAESVIDLASQDVARAGRSISCRSGCGACCRQLVPVAPLEARRLAALVDSQPEPRRTVVRSRFAEAVRRLDAAGLLTAIQGRLFATAETHAVGVAYFRLGIACPFLEDESCSIYAERPVACREYLVTSPAANCAGPTAESVRMLELGARVSQSLGRVGEAASGVRCVPLVLAPEWAAANAESPPRPGPAVLREFMGALSGGRVPPAPQMPHRA
jgi:Fe-S-cluster containining protein